MLAERSAAEESVEDLAERKAEHGCIILKQRGE